VIVIWTASTTLSPALRITRCCCESGLDEAGDRFFGQTHDEAGLAEQKNGHGEGKTAKQDQPVSGIETKYPLIVSTGNHDCSDGT
jgi:hypothetical protein